MASTRCGHHSGEETQPSHGSALAPELVAACSGRRAFAAYPASRWEEYSLFSVISFEWRLEVMSYEPPITIEQLTP